MSQRPISRAPRGRRALGLALGLAALVLLWWLWPRTATYIAKLAPPHAELTTPAAAPRDAGPVRAPIGETFLVDLAALEVEPPPGLDAGIDLRALALGRGGRRHVHIDTCDEPLPERREPDEGLATVVHHGITVAFDRREVEPARAVDLARDASAALDEAAALLESPRREHLLVVAHVSQEAMGEALGEPAWATGVYDGAVHVVADSYERALHHEVLHAQLHAVAPCVPFWLGEGLATRFERDAGRRAFSWLRMLHHHVWIPFASIAEPLASDEGAEHMSHPEVALLYAQSLAMVSFLLARGGPDALARTLRAARDGVPRAALFELILPGASGEDLLDHLAEELFPTLPAGERARLRGALYHCAFAESGYPECALARR